MYITIYMWNLSKKIKYSFYFFQFLCFCLFLKKNKKIYVLVEPYIELNLHKLIIK
jgi:hypothetical protein